MCTTMSGKRDSLRANGREVLIIVKATSCNCRQKYLSRLHPVRHRVSMAAEMVVIGSGALMPHPKVILKQHVNSAGLKCPISRFVG